METLNQKYVVFVLFFPHILAQFDLLICLVLTETKAVHHIKVFDSFDIIKSYFLYTLIGHCNISSFDSTSLGAVYPLTYCSDIFFG